ncbi:SDR family oxidoreductase [Polynucleobacter paneuropaeus]|nr:SDR family oxidoreductase [Polynucleobacter paneuropaeus]
MTHNLTDKVVVVTGGAGRLGKVFSREIASWGGIAIVADVDLNHAKLVAQDAFPESKGFIEAACLDITSQESIENLISHLQKKYGKIDCVINSAYPKNTNYGRKLEDVQYKDFCENINLHLGGYFLVSQLFCSAFKSQGYGNVINISSIYGMTAPRFSIYEGTSMTMPVEYAAIKSAVHHLTQYFAEYFKNTGIRVNCLSPGGIFSGQPIAFLQAYREHCANKGMLNPEDLLGALYFLLSDGSKYVTGQNICVDDGFTL